MPFYKLELLLTNFSERAYSEVESLISSAPIGYVSKRWRCWAIESSIFSIGNLENDLVDQFEKVLETSSSCSKHILEAMDDWICTRAYTKEEVE